MTPRLAILAGSGILPRLIQDIKSNCLAISFQGVEHSMAEPVAIHRVERLGAMFDALRAGGVTHVVMAGAMQRPGLMRPNLILLRRLCFLIWRRLWGRGMIMSCAS